MAVSEIVLRWRRVGPTDAVIRLTASIILSILYAWDKAQIRKTLIIRVYSVKQCKL